jgi:hypothetical protein
MSEKLVVKPAVEQEERLASRVPMLTELTIGLLEETSVFASIIVSGSHPTGYIEEENSSLEAIISAYPGIGWSPVALDARQIHQDSVFRVRIGYDAIVYAPCLFLNNRRQLTAVNGGGKMIQ